MNKPMIQKLIEILFRPAHKLQNDNHRLLCHECAQRLNNRWAFYQLIYNVRGEHVCEECHRSFGVNFTAKTV